LEGKNDFRIFMYWPPQLLPPGSPPVRVEVINSLYGEKQAARIWNETLHNILTGIGLIRLVSDPCVYKRVGDAHQPEDAVSVLFVAIHVDDMFIAASTSQLAHAFIEEFRRHVKKITVFEQFSKYLGMTIERQDSQPVCQVSQPDYVLEMIRSFLPSWDPEVDDPSLYPSPVAAKHIRLLLDSAKQYVAQNQPFSDDDDDLADGLTLGRSGTSAHSKTEGNVFSFLPLIGKLRHLLDNTRPDLLAAVSIIASVKHNNPALDPLVWINLLKHIYFSRHVKLCIGSGRTASMEKAILFGFSDASYIVDGDSKSRLGGCFYLSSDSGAICSYSRKDTTVSHSSTEAEIKAIDLAVRHALHLRHLLFELGHQQEQPTRIYADNKSAIELCESFKTNHLVRHINMRLNYIRECINNRSIELHFIPTQNNVADILTKVLPTTTFLRLQKHLLQGFEEEEMEKLYFSRTVVAHNQAWKDNGAIIVEQLEPVQQQQQY